ncbi:uncharacterized protein C4orf45 homolog [Gigantopelta aegis]|uniref:uncharacterized protein C4orf45 homolog n=1 Tax=Gigantopelta aegis TaxID=1735272 RepID=UPI001B88822E|nr:uncharacterized protein C4orf45 homolog [Gigantopelta aegis]
MTSTKYASQFIAHSSGIRDETPQMARMIFSGPDYVRDQCVTVNTDHRQVGIGDQSRELTSELSYLWRAAPNTPFPRSRASQVGEIGWGIQFFTDWSLQQTGEQIMMGEFRRAIEDVYTHRLQNPR